MFLTDTSRWAEVCRLQLSQPARQNNSEVSESSFANVRSVQTFMGVTDMGAFIFERQKKNNTSITFLFPPNLATIKKQQKAQLVLVAEVVCG